MMRAARNRERATMSATASRALRPAAFGMIVAANTPSVTHERMTIQRPRMAATLPAERADGREITAGDGHESRGEEVVREVADRPFPGGRTHARPQLIVVEEAGDRRPHRADIPRLHHEAGLAVGDRLVRAAA